MAQNLEALVQGLLAENANIKKQHNSIMRAMREYRKACDAIPPSITAQIDSIPGRRIFYNLVGRQNFVLTQAGTRGNPIPFNVSQDGSFVMTHYPMVVWKPNAPAAATNFGRWSPVASWPLPTQEAAAQDRIDLSWEINDGGSQRHFQNEMAGPIFSRPDAMQPLPVPTVWAPNSNIQFIAQFEDIFFAAPATPTTGGDLVVTLPGYRIVNM